MCIRDRLCVVDGISFKINSGPELILKEIPSTTHNLPNDRDRFFTSNLGKVSHLFKLSFKISPYMQQSINIQYYQRI